jgi:hypothetical protein
MKELFTSKLYKSILSIIPLFTLVVICLACNYYYFFADSYTKFYNLLSYIFGFSISSLMPYFYIAYRFDFCDYSKISLWSIFGFILLNIYFTVISMFFDFEFLEKRQFFECSFLTLSLFLTMYSLTKKYFKNGYNN